MPHDDSKKKVSPLEDGLLSMLKALDSQIARELQRTPQQREEFGVTKWEPMRKRVEIVTSTLVAELGNQSYSLEALCVLAQASAKALVLLAEDLGPDGLGEIRAAYIADTFDKITNDLRRGSKEVNRSAEELTQ